MLARGTHIELLVLLPVEVNGLLQLQNDRFAVALGQEVYAAQGAILELVQFRGAQAVQIVLELSADQDHRAEQQAGEQLTAEGRHCGGIWMGPS